MNIKNKKYFMLAENVNLMIKKKLKKLYLFKNEEIIFTEGNSKIKY